jgi:hypothetical protein
MAAVPATIDLTWTSNYAGPHRVCYRIQGSGDPYVCTTDLTPHPNCPGGGLPCGYSLSITVDDETCDTITYEGYVQPTCYDEEDETGRVAFLVSFIPSPACKRWVATCTDNGVDTITVTDGGTGYDPLSAPTVTIGGDGTGATATAVVGQGVISALAINNAGAGYSDGVYAGVNLTGGSGAGATADVTIAGGIVTAATINAGGTGYQDTDVLALDTGVVGVPATPVELGPTTDYGIIQSITVDTIGSGYTVPPPVVIDPPVSGTTATATATLRQCFGPPHRSECTTILGTDFPNMDVGTSVAICWPTLPEGEREAALDIVEDGNCLCTCESVDFTAAGGTATIYAYDCVKGEYAATVIDTTTLNLCVVQGSYYIEDGTGTGSFVVNGACDGDGI